MAQPREPLGKVVFPNSGAPAAQADFLRGVAWLHSFGYEDAIDAFRAAQQKDAGFVLSYWGEALSFNQPLWFFEEPEKGRAALAKLGPTPQARAAKATSPRERMYLAAVEALFAAGTKASRDKAYADAMGALAAQFPDDDEAQAFHALSLLALLPRGDEALPIRGKAGAIVERLFERNPQHPGAAHYVLHAFDHPTLAPRALNAARTYAKIAPASSHALHMPAHAFAAAWAVDGGGSRRPGLMGRIGAMGSAEKAADECPRLPQPDMAAVRVDAAGTIHESAGGHPSDRAGDEGRRTRRSSRRASLLRQRDRKRERPDGASQRPRLDASSLCDRERAMVRDERADVVRQHRRAFCSRAERVQAG